MFCENRLKTFCVILFTYGTQTNGRTLANALPPRWSGVCGGKKATAVANRTKLMSQLFQLLARRRLQSKVPNPPILGTRSVPFVPPSRVHGSIYSHYGITTVLFQFDSSKKHSIQQDNLRISI